MKRDFDDVLKGLESSILGYASLTDFEKVLGHAQKYRLELYILNSLIGSVNIESDFKRIFDEYPNVLRVIPLLLAIRPERAIIVFVDYEQIEYRFKKSKLKFEEISRFMRETGIYNLLETGQIKCLYDYVLGIEVGLDTHARKNRIGSQMERLVEAAIQKLNISYDEQYTVEQIKEKYGIDLKESLKTEGIEIPNRKFDFVLKHNNTLFLIETNFYSSGGSKLNTIARDYKSLNHDLQLVEDTVFIWITDGIGWCHAKGDLRNAYNEMDHLYTLYDLKNAVLQEVVTQ